jgi:hypothetical protein
VGSVALVRFVDVDTGRCGKSALIRVSIVWRGSSGSQESIQNVVGVKPVGPVVRTGDATLLDDTLVVLFWREKDDEPTGILPRAFSDMPRSWIGMLSSADEATDGVRELRKEGDDWEGVGWLRSSSESSESPIANVPSSSGTSERDVLFDRLAVFRVVLSPESTWLGLVTVSDAPLNISFLRRAIRSISCCPLSRVNARSASMRLFDFRMAYIRLGFVVY